MRLKQVLTIIFGLYVLSSASNGYAYIMHINYGDILTGLEAQAKTESPDSASAMVTTRSYSFWVESSFGLDGSADVDMELTYALDVSGYLFADSTAEVSWMNYRVGSPFDNYQYSVYTYQNGLGGKSFTDTINIPMHLYLNQTYNGNIIASAEWGSFAYALAEITVKLLLPDETQPELNPVPEPSTILLLGTGLIGLAKFKRRFKQ